MQNSDGMRKKLKMHAVSLTHRMNENWSYLGEFEAEFKKVLARESGAQGVLFDEKNRG
jgi:hypothetical protein